MITREEAVALLAHAPDYWMAPGDGSIENVQGATIAHVHEHANLRTVDRTGETHSSADARLLAAAPDLARTVVALYDEAASFLAFHRAKADALALELRRLRAAEAPGPDDAAVAPWVWNADIRSWMHDGWFVTATGRFWRADAHHTLPLDPAAIALDAMRAAVPGSV